MADPPAKKPFPVVYVVVPAVIMVLISFLALWQFLTPTDRAVAVPYSDFLAEVRAGKVADIYIHDREIRYRLARADKGSATRVTVGPIPDQALVESLRPTDPSAPLPRIVFEK